MGWFKALFDKSDEGSGEFIRMLYKRKLARSSMSTSRARAFSAAAATLESRWGSMDGFDMESCMFEALPFALLGDDTPDALAAYVIHREDLGSDPSDWLVYQTNRGLNVLLNDDDPQIVNTREWLVEAYPIRYAAWKGWMDDANRARVLELISG